MSDGCHSEIILPAGQGFFLGFYHQVLCKKLVVVQSRKGSINYHLAKYVQHSSVFLSSDRLESGFQMCMVWFSLLLFSSVLQTPNFPDLSHLKLQ